MIYNFRTMDVEHLDLNNISDKNPLKLVFKISKMLLDIGANDNEIFLAKVELFDKLVNYTKVKTMNQRKALTYFLEYLFLIQDDNILKKFKDIKGNMGGVANMSIDEIREKYLKEEGKEEGIKEGEKKKAIEIAQSLLDVLDVETIALKTGLSIDEINKLK
ncbi:MAG: hypothetical protein ACRCXA_06080 [Peptostreptococcaceae bacterium]